MKRFSSLLLSGALVLGMCLACVGFRPVGRKLTLVVMPARYSVLQVGFDVAANYPAVLVSYQGDASTDVPLLHAWNGSEWVYVALDDYRSAGFMSETPKQAVLVGSEKDLPPALIEATGWCPMVMSIPAIDTPTLINSLGKVFAFRDADWQWFARRYNLDLVDLNAQYRTSWYDQPFIASSGPFSERSSGRRAEPTWADTEEPAATEEPRTELQVKPAALAAPQPVREESPVPEQPLDSYVPRSAAPAAEPEVEPSRRSERTRALLPREQPEERPVLGSTPPGWEERAVSDDSPAD